jgi:heme/copper-type cytochrome/quinol oxidase subunit 2
MRRNVVLWVLPLVALAVLAAAMTYLLITLPPRQAAPAIPSDVRRSIFWYWFIASFVVVYVSLLLFVLEEEEI